MRVSRFICSTLLFAATGSSSSILANDLSSAHSSSPKGFFTSIDGLNPNYVETLVMSGHLNAPHGFSDISNANLISKNAKPIITTLTAPSHISTITCTPPSRHEVYANGFYKGDEAVSGFTTEFKTEPLWIAAKRQGLKTLAIAYVGADAQSEIRTADLGIAYPSRKFLSNAKTIKLTSASVMTAELKLNSQSGETRLIKIYQPNRAAKNILMPTYIDVDENPDNGYLAKLLPNVISNFYFVEEKEDSPLFGYKRRFFATLLPETNGNTRIHISGSSYNNAYPKAYRKSLDNADLVWPNYGIRAKNIPIDLMILGQSQIDIFLSKLAKFSIKTQQPDIVLFYQPLIDSIGHKFQGKLPLPFDPANQDEITQAFVKAYQIIDQNLSRVLTPHAGKSVVNLMGDHGMDPVSQVVNLAPLLPEELRAKVKVKTSGALVMIYPNEETNAVSVSEEIESYLKTLRFENQLVMALSLDKRKFVTRSDNFKKEWQFGDAIWTFIADHKFWFQYRAGDGNIFTNPPATGMHGHPASIASMSTGYYLKIPNMTSRKILEKINLIDAVPTFMDSIGALPPKDCLGTSQL